MKFQDDISNMNMYVRTYIHTDKPKPICLLLFQSWGHNEKACFLHMPKQDTRSATKIVQQYTISSLERSSAAVQSGLCRT